MATPIPPQTTADMVVCHTISIDYKPVWDGAAWVITPSDIIVRGVGYTSTAGATSSLSNIELLATDLPPAGQNALNELLQYIEAEMAAMYP